MLDLCHLLFLVFLNLLATIRIYVSDYQADNKCVLSLPVEFGDDFAHCLGSTSGGWNDVLVGTAAITPGLGTGSVHCLLGGCVCMDCGLQRGVSYFKKLQ